WVGTPFGMSWFDGNNFYEPPLKATTGQLYVTNFYKDQKGDIWTTSFYNGIYRYHNGKFTNFLPNAGNIASIQNNVFWIFQYDATRYLVGTDQDILWFDGQRFTPFEEKNLDFQKHFKSFAKLQDGSVLLGGDDGIWLYKNVDGKLEKDRSLLRDRAIHQITLHKENELWISTDKGLYYYATPETFFSQQPPIIYLDGRNTGAISIANDGSIWIASDKLLKIQNNGLLTYDEKNGLPAQVLNIYHDSQDIAWFITSKGLSNLTNEYYEFYDLRSGPGNSMIINIQMDDEHNLWLGSYDGLTKKTKDGFEAVKAFNGKNLGYTSWIHKTKRGEVLAGTEAGILQLNGRGIKKKFDLLSSRIHEDESGRLWLGTVNGKLYSIQNDSLQNIELPGGVTDYIDAIYKDENDFLWIGYRGYGILKFKLKGHKPQFVKEFSAKTGFNDLRIRCSHPDKKGNILFGTRTNGVFIFSTGSDDKYWHVNTSNGLSANWVKSICFDKKENIYLATNRGVNVIAGKNYASPTIRRLNISGDDNEKQTNFVLDENDTIWISTDEGIARYIPARDAVDTTHPRVYLTDLAIDGKSDSAFVPYSTRHHSYRLPYNDNVIEFEFSGVNLKEKGISYIYMLEGQDKNWSNITDRNFISYNLQPGNYTFKVLAINNDGIRSLHPATLSFSIASPFWKSWWFLFLCVASVFVIAYAIYRYRLNQVIKLEKLRSRISSDLHDDIGSTLSSISILSEVAIHENDKQQSINMVKEIKESSISLMEKMDDIIWSVNPKNDSLENLMIRIKGFATRLFEAKDIDYSITIDDSIRDISLSMEYRQHIYLILKEAINNLVKHAGCTMASVQIKKETGVLKISIIDNGKGFSQAQPPLGNGLLNMKERAGLIDAELEIISIPGGGTKISIYSKIK
ncbi:MAG TPA: triple tyrosine motif-containing protein, partial [Chitinophagaceae bacterium]|nr:triple tyrosine motif-containing protein [Chitinophagaceae bacterium]